MQAAKRFTTQVDRQLADFCADIGANIVTRGGGIYAGIQTADPANHLEPIVLFHPPRKYLQTTLGLRLSELSERAVREKISKVPRATRTINPANVAAFALGAVLAAIVFAFLYLR